MENNEKFNDLEKIKQEQNQVEQFQTYQPPAQQAPLDQLKQQLGTIEQDIRKQQLETETSLQGAFSQAASGLGDAQAISQLRQIIGNLGNLVQNQGLQGPAEQYHQMLNQLETDLHRQVQSGSQEVVQSLQQGVMALAQANAALVDCQNYHQLLHYVNQSRLLLVNWETAGVLH